MTSQKKTNDHMELLDEQAAKIYGGTSDVNAAMNMEVFGQTLLQSGAADDPALAELVDATVKQDWGRVGALLPQMISNPLVMNAVNAALAYSEQ